MLSFIAGIFFSLKALSHPQLTPNHPLPTGTQSCPFPIHPSVAPECLQTWHERLPLFCVSCCSQFVSCLPAIQNCLHFLLAFLKTWFLCLKLPFTHTLHPCLIVAPVILLKQKSIHVMSLPPNSATGSHPPRAKGTVLTMTDEALGSGSPKTPETLPLHFP